MKPRHQVSPTAIEMIKRFEGYRRKAARLPDGRWTLGYGHVLTAREGAEVSEQDAEALLLYDLIAVAHAVNELTLTPLTQNQFDALCSFVFNIGVANYKGSAALRRLNEGAILQAAALMDLWRKADIQGERIVVDALVRRRAAEKLLFLTPADGWVAASTPMMPPKADYDAIEALSLQGPSSLTDLLEGAPASEPEEPQPPEEPSGLASERASASVGARLQQIFPEPEPPAGPVLRLTPAPEFDLDGEQALSYEADEAPGQDEPTLFDVAPAAPPPQAAPTHAAANPSAVERITAPKSARSASWPAAIAPVLLAVAGMALAAGALFWGFYAAGEAPGIDPHIVSAVGGIAGVCIMAFAAYLALRRLSGPDET